MVITSRTGRRGRALASLIVLGLLVVACGAPPATTAPSAGSTRPPVPSGPPVLGIDWGKAASVERPEAAFAQPSSLPVPDGTGRSGHPLHFPGQAILADVAVLPHGGLVSVGYVYPGWHPAAWTTPDGQTWSLQDMGETEFTFPVSVAVGADGTIVAVGRSGNRPAAWTSPDGRAWTEHDVATLGDGSVAERMTTVVATSDGYLAGGSVGPELADRHARFWSSADGVTWQPVADDRAAFDDAEVRAITRLGSDLVAVGVVGTAQQITGSVAWRSSGGRVWERVDAADLKKGRAVAVTAAPFGGLVAVGSGLNEEEAFAWTSPDGRAWTIAPGESSRQYPGKVRMTDVAVVGNQVIGVGNYVGLQRGTAISWVSNDGVRWQEARSAPVQEQGEIYAVAAAGPGLVAVGDFGAPDDYIPTVWLSPAR